MAICSGFTYWKWWIFHDLSIVRCLLWSSLILSVRWSTNDNPGGPGPVLFEPCRSDHESSSRGLVGGWALPLWKMMEWKSVGMMTFPIYGKRTNLQHPQPDMYHLYLSFGRVSAWSLYRLSTLKCVVRYTLHSKSTHPRSIRCSTNISR